MNEEKNKNISLSTEDKNNDLVTMGILDTIEAEKNNIKKIDVVSNGILKKLILKVKDELAKDEIKKELNSIVHPLYKDIYNEVFPYYVTLITILIVIAFLLILIIILQVISYKQTNK